MPGPAECVGGGEPTEGCDLGGEFVDGRGGWEYGGEESHGVSVPRGGSAARGVSTTPPPEPGQAPGPVPRTALRAVPSISPYGLAAVGGAPGRADFVSLAGD
ncbi:hypothetical protein GCM10010271_24990 [Streptomyces kurssanovii]|nr:hypothetical protein GCM10010271_24990 [Streptomyces kurssanovii]